MTSNMYHISVESGYECDFLVLRSKSRKKVSDYAVLLTDSCASMIITDDEEWHTRYPRQWYFLPVF